MFVAARSPSTALMDNIRRKQMAWIAAILEAKGWKRQNLAEAAAISPATLTKFFNDPLNAAQLNTRTVEKIAAISPLPPYATDVVVGMGEPEATPFNFEDASTTIARAVAAIKNGQNGLDPWVLGNDANEAAGYRRGDIVMVDLNATPQDGDLVCAQVFGARDAETIFRFYEAPFLTAASTRHQLYKTVLINPAYVQIRGVVVASLRPRPERLAS